MSTRCNGKDEISVSMEAALTAHIKPLLAGAALSGPFSSEFRSSHAVCHDTQHRLRIYGLHNLTQYFVFERTLPFSDQERSFIEGIMHAIRDEALRYNVSLAALMEESVNRAVAGFVAPESTETLLRVIRTYELWSKQRQGRAAHTTGIRLMRRGNTENNFFALAEKGFVRRLGASPDTLVVIDADGGIRRVETIPHFAGESGKRYDILAPIAYAHIAKWANSRQSAAIRLTEDGSILLFARSRLLFAKRGTYWHSPPHTLINIASPTESIEGVEPATLKAVYLTALDMAAGKTGAQVRLVRASQEKKYLRACGKPTRVSRPVSLQKMQSPLLP